MIHCIDFKGDTHEETVDELITEERYHKALAYTVGDFASPGQRDLQGQ